MSLTVERLRQVLHYDPVTGVFTWLVTVSKSIPAGRGAGGRGVNSEGYRRIYVDGVRYKEHRLAFLYMTGEWPEHEVDHRDGDRSNNAWMNLRPATDFQNAMNSSRRTNNVSGLKGVDLRNTGKWRAQIVANHTHFYLGQFDCPAAAHFAYIIAADQLHKEFARTF